MNWHWLDFEHAKHHAVHTEILDTVVQEMTERKHPLLEDIPLPMLFIDQPGMICTTRPIEVFELDGLTLEIPSEDVAVFLLDAEDLKPRVVGGVTFYKLHAWLRCLCLSERQLASFTAMLRARLPDAEVRASEFYATRMVPSEALREANAKATGLPLDQIPNLGANKCDRFKLKSGGEA